MRVSHICLTYPDAPVLIKQVAHYGIADEDAFGGEAQVVVGGVYELAKAAASGVDLKVQHCLSLRPAT